jgi:hypothetical protein
MRSSRLAALTAASIVLAFVFVQRKSAMSFVAYDAKHRTLVG